MTNKEMKDMIYYLGHVIAGDATTAEYAEADEMFMYGETLAYVATHAFDILLERNTAGASYRETYKMVAPLLKSAIANIETMYRRCFPARDYKYVDAYTTESLINVGKSLPCDVHSEEEFTSYMLVLFGAIKHYEAGEYEPNTHSEYIEDVDQRVWDEDGFFVFQRYWDSAAARNVTPYGITLIKPVYHPAEDHE